MANTKGQGSLQWDASKGSGRWVGVVKVEGARHRVVVTPAGTDKRSIATAKTEARRKLDALITELHAGTDRGDGNLTVRDLLHRWQERALPSRQVSARTVAGYRWAIDVLCQELGSKRVRTLTPDHVEAVFDRLAATPERGKRDGGMSRASLVKMRSVLSQALAWGERRGLVAKNVGRVVELPAAARTTPRGHALSVPEAQRLLDASKDDRLHPLWRVLVTLGLRPGEALGLHWDDVDFEHGVVHVRRSLKMVAGSPVVDDLLKTERSRRSVGAPPSVTASLSAWKARQAAERLKAGFVWSKDWPGVVFTSEAGTPLNPSNVRRSFTKLLDAAGLPPVRLYDLRHTATSIMSEQGARMEDIADVLGHVGTRMVQQVYRHQLSPTADAARRVMGGALS